MRDAGVPVLDVRVDLDSLRLDHSDRFVLLEHERGHLFQKEERMSALLREKEQTRCCDPRPASSARAA